MSVNSKDGLIGREAEPTPRLALARASTGPDGPMAAITSIPKGSQIAPATERIYHQSNLVGDWKGTWKNSARPVEFKVINIRGNSAQVEYTHNGRTERGVASVDGATVTFGDVTI